MAIVRIRDLEPIVFARLPDSDAVIRFRNLLVHVYDQVDAQRVYRIAEQDLPRLTAVLKELIAEAEEQGL